MLELKYVSDLLTPQTGERNQWKHPTHLLLTKCREPTVNTVVGNMLTTATAALLAMLSAFSALAASRPKLCNTNRLLKPSLGERNQ